MINFEKKAKNLFDKFFKFQHPDAALRYLPVVKKIKETNLTDSKILEVGSGSLGITPYIKKKIDGIDVDFSGPKTELISRIKGTATKLPFNKNSYDVVISSDVLEHIARQERETAIYEMLRVAKKLAIIIVPAGEASEKQDKKLDAYYKKVFKTTDLFLSEHVANGLPKTDEILVAIDKSLRKLEKNANVASYGYLNLQVREFLMKTWITKNKYIYYLYLKGYLLLLPLLKLANWGNCYRRMFTVEIK